MKICLYNINFLPFDDAPPSILSSVHHSISSYTHTSSYYRIITQIYIFLHALRALEVFSGIFRAFHCSVSLSLHFVLTAPIITPTIFIVCSPFSAFTFRVEKFFLFSVVFSRVLSRALSFTAKFEAFFRVWKNTPAFALLCHLAFAEHTKLAISISENDSNENYKRKSQL